MSQSLDINLHQNPNFDVNSLKTETFRMTFQEEKYDTWKNSLEYKKLIRYMKSSNGLTFYKDTSDIDNIYLPHIDLLTPDWSWIFENKQRYLIENASLKPNQEFIDDAIAWCDDLQYFLDNKDIIFNNPYNQKLFLKDRISNYFKITSRLEIDKPIENVEVNKDFVKGEIIEIVGILYDRRLIVNAEELINFIFKYNYPILSQLQLPH